MIPPKEFVSWLFSQFINRHSHQRKILEKYDIAGDRTTLSSFLLSLLLNSPAGSLDPVLDQREMDTKSATVSMHIAFRAQRTIPPPHLLDRRLVSPSLESALWSDFFFCVVTIYLGKRWTGWREDPKKEVNGFIQAKVATGQLLDHTRSSCQTKISVVTAQAQTTSGRAGLPCRHCSKEELAWNTMVAIVFLCEQSNDSSALIRK